MTLQEQAADALDAAEARAKTAEEQLAYFGKLHGEEYARVVAKLDAAEAEVARLREALERIAEGRDAGRHDGLPEDCPAHDHYTMWLEARAALIAQ